MCVLTSLLCVQPNKEAITHHLKRAALSYEGAQLAVAHMSDGQEVSPFPAGLFPVDIKVAFQYYSLAARNGDRFSMEYIARLFEKGVSKGEGSEAGYDIAPSWRHATMWYACAAEAPEGEDDVGVSPRHKLFASSARLHSSGGHGLTADAARAAQYFSKAVDAALEAGAHRSALQYQTEMEEAQARVEEGSDEAFSDSD